MQWKRALATASFISSKISPTMVSTRTRSASKSFDADCKIAMAASNSTATLQKERKTPATTPKRSKKSVKSVVSPAGKSPAKRKPKASPSKIRVVDEAYVHDKSSPILELVPDLVQGSLVCRPSKRNKSPYVADLLLAEENREAIVHVPNLDMGGKLRSGTTLIAKPARDSKGQLVGPDAVNPKYGTPKCEYIAQLLYVEEESYEPVYVGAHPNLGEQIAEQLVHRNLLFPELPRVQSYEREVRNICGTSMRADFVLRFVDTSKKPCILEVKTVVDTDYDPTKPIPVGLKCEFLGHTTPYRRTGIFPWGNSNQKGPDGEAVVSARAIKHVHELTQIAKGKKHEGEDYDSCVLFVVIRGDAEAFRPNHEACPSFCRYLKRAEQSGVKLLAKQVRWGEGDQLGKCFEGPLLDIEWPDEI